MPKKPSSRPARLSKWLDRTLDRTYWETETRTRSFLAGFLTGFILLLAFIVGLWALGVGGSFVEKFIAPGMASALIMIVGFFAVLLAGIAGWRLVTRRAVDFLGGALSAPSLFGILIGFIAVPLVLAFFATLITKVYEVIVSTVGR
jgi:hypothetical protein